MNDTSETYGKCGVCGQLVRNHEGTLPLCVEHAAVARRLAKLTSAGTAFDLVAPRSHGVREDPDGRPTTYDLAPESDIERVVRDVEVSLYDVPLFAVEALFTRLYDELGRPDFNRPTARIEVKFEGLDEVQYAKLNEYEDRFWVNAEHEVVRTRLYAPEKLRDAKLKQVEREEKAREKGGDR